MQNLNLMLDISAVIWDEVDYDNNMQNYYDLVDGWTALLTTIANEKPKVLISSMLQNEMMANFPFGKPPFYNSTFEKQTLSFLSRVETIEFPDSQNPYPLSNPNLIKNHFNSNIKVEICKVIAKIHLDDSSASKYFTFKYLWNGEDKLKTISDDKTNIYETIIADKNNELNDFFEKFRPKFEHNPKHDKTQYNTKEYWEKTDDQDGFVSRLSCFGGVNNNATEILSKRFPNLIDNCYFGYDDKNEVYVVFRRTHIDKNVFHGYDENNSNKIPNEVRKHFNK